MSLGLIAFFALLTLWQLGMNSFSMRCLRRVRTEPLADAECPPALVVLCLRGGDPFLGRSLRHLIEQDYPDFRVRIVVDSPGDEAHRYLAEIWGASPPSHVEVRTLTERFSTCTFKMSGILAGTTTLAGVHVFFPDPWHKKKHHKRRLIQAGFVSLLASRLAPGGTLCCATDWQPYAEQMLEVLTAEPALRNTSDGFAPAPALRSVTKFEQRGIRLGHAVWDLVFMKKL